MDKLLQYLLVLFASYLGLAIGVIISHMAKEELSEGKKYFRIAKPVIFAFILFNFLNYLQIEMIISAMASFFLCVITYIFESRMKFINADLFFYGFFAVILFETKKSGYFPILRTLIFIYGLIAASIASEKIKDLNLFLKIKNALLNNIIYLVLSLVLIAVFRT